MLEMTIQVPEPLAAELMTKGDRLSEVLAYGLQQLPGILKIAAPKQRSALASQAKGRIGSRRIVGHMHAFRWRNTCFGAPDR